MPLSIEDHIQKAMQEGKFNDLPGKGQPLRLDEDPHEDPDWRLAYHVLRGSGYTLPWIAARQEIEAEITTARQALQTAWSWRQEALRGSPPPQPYEQVEAVWQHAVATFGEKVERINKLIFDYNLQAPLERFQLLKLSIEQEIDVVKRSVEK
jgi:DnaJ family protein C protein 28